MNKPCAVLLCDDDKVLHVVGTTKDSKKRFTINGREPTSWLELYNAVVPVECPPVCLMRTCFRPATKGAHVHVNEVSCSVNYILPTCSDCNNERCYESAWLRVKEGTYVLKIPASSEVCPGGKPIEHRECKAPGQLKLARIDKGLSPKGMSHTVSRRSVLQSVEKHFGRNLTEVAVWFMSPGCPPCMRFKPTIKAFNEDHKAENVGVVCCGGNAANLPTLGSYEEFMIQDYQREHNTKLTLPTVWVLDMYGNVLCRNAVGDIENAVRARSRSFSWTADSGVSGLTHMFAGLSTSPSRGSHRRYTRSDLCGMSMSELRRLVEEEDLDVCTNTGGVGRRTKADVIDDILEEL